VGKIKDYLAAERNENFSDIPYVRTAAGVGDNDDECGDPILGWG